MYCLKIYVISICTTWKGDGKTRPGPTEAGCSCEERESNLGGESFKDCPG